MQSLAVKPRAVLDRDTIVQVALDLLEECGIEGLSTRRLALELGVKGPSLYWHFHSKADLLAAMSTVLFAEAVPKPVFDVPDFDWDAWMIEGARGLRRVALSRRDGAAVMARARPVQDNNRSSEVRRCLSVHSGLSLRDSELTLRALGRYAMGWVLYEQTAAAARETLDGGDAGFEHGLQTFMKGLRARVAEL